MEFFIGGVAAASATAITNPYHVLKTKMELQKENRKYQESYCRNIIHAGYSVAKNEGIFALQRGLTPAMAMYLVMYGTKLGTYHLATSRGLVTNTAGEIIVYKSVIACGLGGLAGQFLSTPLLLVKTIVQNASVNSKRNGAIRILKNIYKMHGVSGLFKGGITSIPRAFIGTSQLTTFGCTKEFLHEHNWFRENPIYETFFASFVGGTVLSLFMTPFDLVLTRYYAQGLDKKGKGLMYENYFDCLKKVCGIEGLEAFLKHLKPVFLKTAPHTILCLVFWDGLRNLYDAQNASDCVKKQ